MKVEMPAAGLHQAFLGGAPDYRRRIGMSKHPVTRPPRVARKVERNAVEVIPAVPTISSFSFRYSYTEISALGDRTHVKARRTQLANGKLTSEAFDGDFDRAAYERIVREAQHFFLNQTALFMKSLSWLLPPSRRQGPDRD
jgi:hypothetical protein